jgi:cytosine/adenosine deaminase-related metal-dependent hydrolase
MADRIGSLEAGKDADFIIVDVAAADPAGRVEGPAEQVLARLVHRSAPAMVKAAFVRGRPCPG